MKMTNDSIIMKKAELFADGEKKSYYQEHSFHLQMDDETLHPLNVRMTERNMSDRLRQAPVGTKAPAINGGHWIKTERGWKWCTGDTFPTPGGDWNGKLVYPSWYQFK